jgi:hypothetical protein
MATMTTPHDANASPDETWNQWAGLLARSMEAQARLTRDATDVFRRAGEQTEIPASLLDRGQLEAWGREGLQYWSDIVTLGIGYVNNVIEVTQSAAGRLLQDVDVVARPDRAHAPAERIPVDLTGAVGEPISTQVTIGNTRGTTRRVEFEVGRFTNADGPLHPHVTFDPSHSILAPNQERVVTMRVEIDPKDIAVGDVCHGEIRILGGDDVVLALTIRIE